MVIALNMMDIADRMGIKIDFKKLGQQLGAVVVPLVGSKNIGTKELLDAISGTQTKDLVNAKVDYGPDVEPAIANLTDAIEKWASSNIRSAGWLSSSWRTTLMPSKKSVPWKAPSPSWPWLRPCAIL